MENIHEAAIKTHEAILKRRKEKEVQYKRDIQSTGWNGYNKYRIGKMKRYY